MFGKKKTKTTKDDCKCKVEDCSSSRDCNSLNTAKSCVGKSTSNTKSCGSSSTRKTKSCNSTNTKNCK